MVAKTQRDTGLDRLDKAVFGWLHNLDAVVASRLQRLDNVVVRGASKQLVKKRTGNWFGDCLSSLWFRFWQMLDKLDTRVFYRGRPYQAKVCRVRSKSEKKIANWLTDHGIEFVYEKRLRLGKQTVRPDFYLISHQVYLEFWGLIDSDPHYRASHAKKVKLYERHGVQVVPQIFWIK